MIAGLTLALLAVGSTRTSDRPHTVAWVTPVIGAWVIVSPWVIYHGTSYLPLNAPGTPPPDTAARLSNVIAGAVVVLAGLCLTSTGRGFRAPHTSR